MHWLWSQKACFGISGLSLAGGLTLGKSFNFFLPCSPSHETGMLIITIAKDYRDN